MLWLNGMDSRSPARFPLQMSMIQGCTNQNSKHLRFWCFLSSKFLRHWIEILEFRPRTACGKLPINALLGSLQALACRGTEFNLDNIEPAPIFWRVMDFQSVRMCLRSFQGEGLVGCSWFMRAEVIADKNYLLCIRIIHFEELLHLMSSILLCSRL